jgi:hypothetical protein
MQCQPSPLVSITRWGDVDQRRVAFPRESPQHAKGSHVVDIETRTPTTFVSVPGRAAGSAERIRSPMNN